ncbi:MAG: prepilin-type N-terminal cleavage/methylation domain-containing protein, partial [Planctomycetales bacterium]|nr:prepilin-type N-terminal cleavage/methylation domain-containing protein [Planctomycetales bacterium]
MPGRRRFAGFTLLELLIVTSIIAMVAGMSLAFLSRVGRSLAVTTFRGQVNAVIRAARNTAITENGPVTVVVDPEEREISAVVRRTVGFMQFEPGRESEGAFGLAASFHGETESTWGKIGGALRLGRGANLDLGTEPFDFVEGGALDVWLMPDPQGRGGIVASKGQAYGLEVLGDGIVAGFFRLEGKQQVESPEPITPGRWTHVELAYDTEALRLLLDGREVATWRPKPGEAPPRPAPDASSPLRVGDPRRPFAGRVDQFRVSEVFREEPHRAPAGVEIVGSATTARRITFLGSGGLDPRRHFRPERITLRSTITGKVETVDVGLT